MFAFACVLYGYSMILQNRHESFSSDLFGFYSVPDILYVDLCTDHKTKSVALAADSDIFDVFYCLHLIRKDSKNSDSLLFCT